MNPVIALDIGKKRTGIAKSDALGIAIKALKTIETLELIEELTLLIDEYKIDKIFIGLPQNPEGKSQETLDFIQQQSEMIQNKFPSIELIFLNEAYSSREAEARLKAKGIKLNQDNKGLVDMEAASILLEQAFLDKG